MPFTVGPVGIADANSFEVQLANQLPTAINPITHFTSPATLAAYPAATAPTTTISSINPTRYKIRYL
jgi:hypothetical protein